MDFKFNDIYLSPIELSLAIVGSRVGSAVDPDTFQRSCYKTLLDGLLEIHDEEAFPDTEEFWQGPDALRSSVSTTLPTSSVWLIAQAIETAHTSYALLTPEERGQVPRPVLRLIVSPQG